ncbi:hypothetical protein diail_10015 [Diaporthe ilicicola]|nr:hypothetical protein diail_10015 [Diaporthe ilicicola]
MSSAPSPSSGRSDTRSTRSPGAPRRSQQPEQAEKSEAVQTPEAELEARMPPCCIIRARGGDSCEPKFLSTAGELQAEVDSGLVDHGAPVVGAATSASIAAVSQQDRREDGAARPFIIMRGLPAPFLPILLDSPLDIDPAFVDAHAAGRSYRALGVRRGRGRRAARYACWDYPELVTGDWQALVLGKPHRISGDSRASAKLPEDVTDLVRQQVVRPVSDTDEELAAVFCRASLWASQDVDVLFLDRSCWGRKGPLRKARRAAKVTEVGAPMNQGHGRGDCRMESGDLGFTLGKGDEVPSLEGVLQDSLASAHEDSGGVSQALEETAYEQWLELFEVLTPRQSVVVREDASIWWRIMQALERNLDMAKNVARRQDSNGAAQSIGTRPDDWGSLIQRLRTRAQILATIPPAVTHKKPGKSLISGTTPIHEERLTYVPRHRPTAETPASPSSDENQRSLDRVTYLGGALLPFSVVSGVLSMNEGFEPGQPLFWVFWVATIPLTLFTVLVIYADKLRQVEVWAEVPAAGGSVSEGAGSTAGGGGVGAGSGPKVEDTEKWANRQRPARFFGASRSNRRQQPEAVSYSAAGDVVIDLGSPAAEPQQEPFEAPEPSGEYWRADGYQGQEGTSSEEEEAEEVALPITSQEYRHHRAWKKQQLGWAGAAMCIMKAKKPLRVSDGLPSASRDVRSISKGGTLKE